MQEDFDQIYQNYFDPVYRYVLSISENSAVAEEITQETFFKALESIDAFRGESSMKTWLCSIAKHIFLSQQRKRKPVSLEDLAERRNESAGPEEQALLRADSLRLHRLLHTLPEPYKEVFSLRVFAQLGFREIGALFGKNENWACVVFHRARVKLSHMEDTI